MSMRAGKIPLPLAARQRTNEYQQKWYQHIKEVIYARRRAADQERKIFLENHRWKGGQS